MFAIAIVVLIGIVVFLITDCDDKYIAGWLGCGGVLMLHMDILGKTAYLKAVNNWWVDGWYIWPMDIGFIVASILLFKSAHNKGE